MSTNANLMYIRVKRKATTTFLHVKQTSKFAELKVTLATIQQTVPENIQLYHSDKTRELVDIAMIADHSIKNDDIIYMVMKKEGTETWENIEVEELTTMEEVEPAAATAVPAAATTTAAVAEP